MKYYIKDQDLHWYIKHVIKCVIYLYIFMEKILPLIWSFLFFFWFGMTLKSQPSYTLEMWALYYIIMYLLSIQLRSIKY